MGKKKEQKKERKAEGPYQNNRSVIGQYNTPDIQSNFARPRERETGGKGEREGEGEREREREGGRRVAPIIKLPAVRLASSCANGTNCRVGTVYDRYDRYVVLLKAHQLHIGSMHTMIDD